MKVTMIFNREYLTELETERDSLRSQLNQAVALLRHVAKCYGHRLDHAGHGYLPEQVASFLSRIDAGKGAE